MQAIFTVGISASGKTTWANNFIKNAKKNNEIWKNINQDDIRLSIIKEKQPNVNLALALKQWDYSPYGESEKLVKSKRDILIKQAIEANVTGIILSDTNLTGLDDKVESLINLGINLKNIHFQVFKIELEEALKRNKQRKYQVDEKIIAIQLEKFNNYLLRNHKKNKMSL